MGGAAGSRHRHIAMKGLRRRGDAGDEIVEYERENEDAGEVRRDKRGKVVLQYTLSVLPNSPTKLIFELTWSFFPTISVTIPPNSLSLHNKN